MKVRKLSLAEFVNYQKRPTLNPFWNKYFADIAVEFNKMFFDIFRENVKVKALNYQVYDLALYLNQLEDESYLQFFQIIPHQNTFGFYQLPSSTSEKLLMALLGGKAKINSHHKLTHFDQALLEIISNKLSSILQKPFLQDQRAIEIQFFDHQDQELFLSVNQHGQSVGIQHFVLQIEQEYYHFDIAFTKSFLGKLQLL
jgi:flagellar motor switch protein FliM